MPPAKKKPPPPAGSLWIEDAATYIGVTLSTLYKWRARTPKKGPTGYPIGRHIAYKIADLDAYLKAQYEAATAPKPPDSESRPPEPRTAPTGRRRTHGSPRTAAAAGR